MMSSFMLLLLVLCFYDSFGLSADDAGVLDFHIATGGGPPSFVVVQEDQVLLATKEYVSSRSVRTGSLQWRRSLCAVSTSASSTTSTSSATSISVARDLVVTTCGSIARVWKNGTLVLDQSLIQKAVAVESEGIAYASLTSSDGTVLYTADGIPVTDQIRTHHGPSGTLETKATCGKLQFSLDTTADASVLLVDGRPTVTRPLADPLVSMACSSTTAVYTTQRGLVAAIDIETLQELWHTEEGLAHATAALILDAVLVQDAQETLLTLSHRLESQVQRLFQTRPNAFGFEQTILLLAKDTLYGIPTSGDQRAQVQYTVALPPATTHRLLHHAQQVLVLSQTKDQVHYSLLDGTTGVVRDSGTVPGRVVQVLPHGAAARLVFPDGTTQAVPPTADVPNDLFYHTINQQGLQSYQADGTMVGSLALFGESIVQVAYPPRDEVVQSPCHALGDNSLLLKYRNPHLMVIVTRGNNDAVARRMMGTDQHTPNLFVHVVDTVAGRILHRVSHTDASDAPVAVVISENWIFYAFHNQRTRRTEIGVLTLYEGQIHESGLTAFSTPDRTTTFSSLEEAKPVVLAKSYSMPEGVTALGVTHTRGGISPRRLLLATQTGQIVAVDRKMLDTRRPLGAVNEAEKKEGLVQYNELIPNVSYMRLSYTQLVEGVTAIISAPTDLESQTLVLAYGGSDVFFTRTSPSRGFDLLPDSFNKALLVVVVVALLGAVGIVQNRAHGRTKQQGWM